MMYKKYFNGLLCFIIALLSVVFKSQAQDLPKELYIAANIPDSLKENANSVVRYSDITQTVKGPGDIVVKYHTLVTILNEKGDREAMMDLPYNKKFNSLSSIEMRVFNEKGELIKKYHKSDMYDGAAGDDETLVSDDRFLAVEHTIAAYPVTIEKEYEEDITSQLDLRGWYMQDDEQSVQYSYYNLSINAQEGFRSLNKNINIKPEKTDVNGICTYKWQVFGLKAFKKEEGAQYWRVLPSVEFASNSFKFYGIPGMFDSWQNYGKWQLALNSDVCSLTPEREAEIRKMTDSIKTDKEKVKFLYNYLQQNMRYVNVQLGIGGLKPFPATFVDQKKYGDCKALSNYMGALLKAVNIPSCYAMINEGINAESAKPNFPFDPFNHIILCVPLKGDTTWLECTSQYMPFGKLGPHTENRYALLIDNNGGKLVKTPSSTASDNQFNSYVRITIDPDGGAKAQIKIFSTGEYRFDYIGLSSLKMDEQKTYFQRAFNMKQPINFDIKPIDDKNGVKETEFDVEYDKFYDIAAGDKQFYKPHVFDLVAFTIPVEENRKSDYYFEHPMQKSCVTTIDLPQGFEIETLPTNQTLKFTYGNYEVTYTYDAAKNQVTSIAKFNLTNHVIPAAKYTELQQYLDAVIKAQNKKLVIRRKA